MRASERRARLGLRVAGLVGVLLLAAVTALGLLRVSELVGYIRWSTDSLAELSARTTVPPELMPPLTWRPDVGDTGRAMAEVDRRAVADGYLRAWLQLNIAVRRGTTEALPTYFAGPALAAVTDLANQTRAASLQVNQGNLAHELQLHFFSADGSIVAFTDFGYTVAQQVRDEAGHELFADQLVGTHDVVMQLQDGYWRVWQWQRREGAVVEGDPLPAPTARAGFVRRAGRRLVLDGRSLDLAGLNYYPQATPWDRFWPSYDPAIVQSDLARMRALGLNTIRVFVPYTQFGGGAVDPTMLGRLANLLDLAQAQGMRVIVTLFDFRHDYQPLEWVAADRHLAGLLPPLSEHPAILAWDLKNEPDLDYEAGPRLVQAWLAHTARQVRRLAPNHLITIGWAYPDNADALAEIVDFVSFHYYKEPAALAAQYATLRTRVDGPIVLGEFGHATWLSPLAAEPSDDAAQAVYFAQTLGALRATDAAGYLAWTLYDFGYVPTAVVGAAPWQRGPQQHFGVLRGDGAAKPAAALLRPNASLAVPPAPTWLPYLRPGLLAALAGGVLIAVALSLWWWRRRRGQRRQPPVPGGRWGADDGGSS